MSGEIRQGMKGAITPEIMGTTQTNKDSVKDSVGNMDRGKEDRGEETWIEERMTGET